MSGTGLALFLTVWPAVHSAFHAAPSSVTPGPAALAATVHASSGIQNSNDECPVCTMLRAGFTDTLVVASPVVMAELGFFPPPDDACPALPPRAHPLVPRAPPHI
jgi:hypothetical protein